jgi:hypothetical protein
MDTMIFIWRNFGSVLSVTSKTMIDLQWPPGGNWSWMEMSATGWIRQLFASMSNGCRSRIQAHDHHTRYEWYSILFLTWFWSLVITFIHNVVLSHYVYARWRLCYC